MFSPVCYLREEDIMGTEPPLRIGYVPEHFSTPIYFAQQRFGLQAKLVAFPSGTGHMITALRAGEIDIGIGLTEGWVAGLGKEDVSGDGGYQLVGTYVETPLCEFFPWGQHHLTTGERETSRGLLCEVQIADQCAFLCRLGHLHGSQTAGNNFSRIPQGWQDRRLPYRVWELRHGLRPG